MAAVVEVENSRQVSMVVVAVVLDKGPVEVLVLPTKVKTVQTILDLATKVAVVVVPAKTLAQVLMVEMVRYQTLLEVM
jgi:hypothetical protein